MRNKEAKNPADHIILPELISKEPLGPMVRRGDDEWFAIVKWTIYGLLEAEEYGVTQGNVDQLKTSTTDPVVQRLLGIVEKLKEQGTTMVLVEQSVNVALSVADRAVFMERGQVKFEGPAQELLERDDLLRAVFLSGEGA